MLKVYTKTAEELIQEQSLYDFGAHVVKAAPTKVWPTYVMVKDGFEWVRVDLRDLTSNQIIELIKEDLKDPNSHGAGAFELLRALKGVWRPSFDDVLVLYDLEKKHGHVIRDIIGTLRITMIETARVVAKYIKESQGDFTPVTSDDEVAVIKQLKQNAIAQQSAFNAQRR